jgi:predicted molibdopterin-dependent oxidoreductase YjgC
LTLYRHRSTAATSCHLRRWASKIEIDVIDRIGSAQWPCDENAPEGTEVLHRERFPRANGRGTFMLTEYVPTAERTSERFPNSLLCYLP